MIFCSHIFKWNWSVKSFLGSAGDGQASPLPCTHRGAVVPGQASCPRKYWRSPTRSWAHSDIREGRGQHKMEVTNSPNKWTKPCDGGSQDRWPSVTQALGPLWKVTKVTQLAGWGKTPTLESRTSHASYWLSTCILWTWHLTQLSFQPPSEV